MNAAKHMPDTALHIEVVSDLVSPWCFISRRRLQRALQQVDGALAPALVWTPFELNPEMPSSGRSLEDYLVGVFGSTEAARPVLDELTRAGESEGIRFNFEKVRSVPNTRDAHRLVIRAEDTGQAAVLVEYLFNGFFGEGLDIGDRRVLVELAERAGMSPAEVERYLASDEGRADVLARQARVRYSGLTAVPGLIVNGRVAVLGAQDPETIVSAIDQALFPGLQPEADGLIVH
jgi:predicted DsbA family dithiol-disulfide isomerase